ncbi:hypothetical protein BG004_005992 [Podila humilis]|nr:hypothetical protein BG004_005992 [Podila humilis]
MLIFWLDYHGDDDLLEELHGQLLKGDSRLSRSCAINDYSRQILTGTRPNLTAASRSSPTSNHSKHTHQQRTSAFTKRDQVSTTVPPSELANHNAVHKGIKVAQQGSTKSSLPFGTAETGSSDGLLIEKVRPPDFHTAMKEFKSALEDERTPPVEAANVLLRGLIRENRFEESVTFFQTLTENHGIQPNENTYRRLVKLTAAYGQLAMTQRLISVLEGLGIRQDAELSRDLMRSFVRSGNMKGAIKVFESMETTGVIRDIHHINVLLEGATGGDLISPAKPLSEPASAAISTNMSHLTTIGVLEIMRSFRLQPNAKTWYYLLSGAFRARERVLAQHMYHELSRYVEDQRVPQHHQPILTDAIADDITSSSKTTTAVSIPIVEYASRHPDTFQLLVEEYARRYGVEPATLLLKQAFDAEYPARISPSLQKMQRALAVP